MAWILESRLLGRFEVFSKGTEVWVPRGKQREILIKLLTSEGAIVTADELAELFWPYLPAREGLELALHRDGPAAAHPARNRH